MGGYVKWSEKKHITGVHLSLIHILLMISRLETKELMPTKEMLCVKSVAEEVKKTLKPLADENNVSLEIHCCDEFVLSLIHI